METRSRLQMKLLFCLADLLLVIVGSTVAQTCTSCDLCTRCAAGEQNRKHYVGVLMLQAAVPNSKNSYFVSNGPWCYERWMVL